VVFYEADFNAGLRFPLRLFMRELLKRLRLSPGQLTPNAWWTVISYMVLWRVSSKGADSITVHRERVPLLLQTLPNSRIAGLLEYEQP
jgi:hypothetical protein